MNSQPTSARVVALASALVLIALAAAPVASAAALDQQADSSMEVCVPFTTVCFQKFCISTTTLCIFCDPGSNPCTLRD